MVGSSLASVASSTCCHSGPSPIIPHLDHSHGPQRSPSFDLCPTAPTPASVSSQYSRRRDPSRTVRPCHSAHNSQWLPASLRVKSTVFTTEHWFTSFTVVKSRVTTSLSCSGVPPPLPLSGLYHVGLLPCMTTQPASTPGPLHQLSSVFFAQVALFSRPLLLQILLKHLYMRDLHVKSS